jgi:hypothetical protein
MKYLNSLLLTFVLLFSFIAKVHAQKDLEIQCHSPLENLDIVFKRSPETQRAYVLLMSPEQLETYAFLDAQFIEEENDSSFRFQSEEIKAEVDLIQGTGSLKIEWPQFSELPISLNHCISTASIR